MGSSGTDLAAGPVWARVDVTIPENRRVCRKLDWRNDEPGASNPYDCAIDAGTQKSTADDTCVPVPE